MGTWGYRPWLSSFGVVLAQRALDQVRMLVAQPGAPVRIAAADSGILDGASGKTHQDIEDLAIVRGMPGMTVIPPADEVETASAIRWADALEGPVYLRLARGAVTPAFTAEYRLERGAVRTVREGHDITLVSTGVQISRTLEHARLLAEHGVSARVAHAPSIKPLESDGLLAAVAEAPAVITIEERSVLEGLGSIVAEHFTDSGVSIPLSRVGLDDARPESTPNDFLLHKHDFSPTRVCDQVRDRLS